MGRIEAVLIPGDGIGPEIAAATRTVFAAAQAPIDWIEAQAGLNCVEKYGIGCPKETLELVAEKRIALKGPTATPIGGGHKSVNVTIRKALDLYSNVRPVRTLPGVDTRFPGVDIIIVRENIEDTYGGIEHMQSADVAQCLRIMTRPGCRKIANYAFEMAVRQGRKKIACIQKANIMKMTDGLFLEAFRETAARYPQIQASEMLVDNCCMQLVTRPTQFDVLLLPNLFGDIVSDLAAGLVGGLGIAPGGNIGDRCAVFEAVHGTAPDIVGKGLANPTALIQSGIAMLRHLGLLGHADLMERGLVNALQAGVKTRDLGGTASTGEFTDAVCREITNIGAPVLGGATIGALPKITAPSATFEPTRSERRVVGFDYFTQHVGVPAVPEKIGPFALRTISNRGTKVGPGGNPPAILLVDVFSCRYEAAADANVTDADVLSAISSLDAKFPFVHIEKLHYFDDKAGYSLAQGQ